MTNPQFTLDPNATTPGSEDPAAGGGNAIDQTWDRPRQNDDGRQPGDGGLPEQPDLPGQEIPTQDPDLEPVIGDEEEEVAGDDPIGDPMHEDNQPGGQGGRPTQI